VDVLELVRAAARRRMTAAALAAAARGATGSWRAAEQAIAAELGASPRRARRTVDAFGRVAAASGDREARGRAARLAGSLFTYLGEFAKSRDAYLAAIALLDGPARDGARLGLAAAQTRLGRFAAARAVCRSLRASARRRDDAALRALADLNEAVAVHEGGDPRASVRLYERALSAFDASGDRRMRARCTMNLANALVLLDRYDDAAPRYAAAAADFAALGQAFDAARCRYNAGALAVSTERLGDADAELAAAESEFLAMGDATHAALARLDRGEAMLRAGLSAEALRLLASARRGLGRGAPPAERLRAARLGARAALAAGDVAAARRLAAEPAPAGMRGADAERHELAGRVLAAEGRSRDAVPRLLRAARAFGAARPAARARCTAAAAWCAAEAGDAAKARRLARAASRDAERTGVPGLAFAAAAAEFLAEDAAGRRGPAGRALRRSIDALERVRAGLGPDAMRAALLTGREAWLARAVRHALAGDDGPSAALALVERFRARGLVDLLGAADAAAPRDERVARLRARVALLERRADGAAQPAFLRAAAAPVTRDVRSAERALAGAERRSAPLRDAADLAAVRGSLPDGTLAVSLFSDDADVHVFAVSRDGVRAVAQRGAAAAVAPLIEDLRYTIGKFALGDDYARRHGARLTREADDRLASLARVALGPVEDEIARAERVVVVPHGAWNLVPFAALPVGGRPLVERCTVAMTPALGALARDLPQPDGRPIVLAASDAGAPSIDGEARDVAGVLPDSRLLAGDDARADVLAAASSPSCVHVAAHGRYRPDAPAMSGVRLADGWLRAIDFASLRLPGALVVLSGCETGVTRAGPGDEVHGLVRGVFASGAADLVASLWRVGDDSARRLMTDFHARRAAGAPAEAALAAAQRDAISRGAPVWAWAAFALWTRRASV
jgi:hypothetical protein